MDSRVRILYLDYTNQIGIGGGQRSLALLLANLPRGRYEPVVACPAREEMRRMLASDVRVVPLEMGERFRSMSRRQWSWWRLIPGMAGGLGIVRRLNRIVRENRVDLVHANNLKMAALALAATRAPVIWHLRDIFPRRGAVSHVVRAAARAVSRILAVSRAAAGSLPATAPVTILYNAVDVPGVQLEGPDLRRGLGIEPGTPVIGYSGRLDHGKGVELLLEAFAEVRARTGARLLVAGEGPLRDRISGPGVIRLGFQDDLGPFWRTVDVAVQPSTEADSFPRSVVEAMGNSKPVAGSDAGGIPEAIEDGVTGCVFRAGDGAALGSILFRLAGDRALRESMGRAGRERAVRLFSAQEQMRRLTTIYESVLEEARRCQGAA